MLKLLGNLPRLPDELYVMLKQNFTNYGKLIERVRKFEQPSFRPDGVGKEKFIYDRNTTGKRYNPKKTPKKKISYNARKNIIL